MGFKIKLGMLPPLIMPLSTANCFSAASQAISLESALPRGNIVLRNTRVLSGQLARTAWQQP